MRSITGGIQQPSRWERRSLRGKRHDERGRPLRRLSNLDVPTVRFDGPAAEVETEPHVGGGALAAAREFLEDAPAIGGRNARAGIRDRDLDGLAAVHVDADAPVARCVTERVVENVLDDAQEQVAIGVMICTGGDTPAADKGRAFTKRTDPW